MRVSERYGVCVCVMADERIQCAWPVWKVTG